MLKNTGWWKACPRLRVVLLALALATGLNGPLRTDPAAAQAVTVPSAVENFAYPDAAGILANRGIRLIAGNGNLRLIDCPPGLDVTDGLIRLWTSDLDDLVCFRIDGPAGYLALELPNVYSIETNESLIRARLRRIADGAESSVDLPRDDANCTPQTPGCWNGVGHGATGEADASVLLELDVRAVEGAGPALLPAPAAANLPVGRLTAGAPGRGVARGCSATLVAREWVLTAASCFSNPSWRAGPPPVAATVDMPGRGSRNVVHLVPHADRDVVLARLDAEVVGVTPAVLAASAPASGQALRAVGFGRTGTEWVPKAVHQSAATATGVTASTVAISTSNPVCKGDAGGPLLDAGNQVMAVITGSGQQGCLSATGTTAEAVTARVDDIRAWITAEVTAATGYVVSPETGMCVDISPLKVLWTAVCNGGASHKWAMRSDQTIRNNAQPGLCVDLTDGNPADRTYVRAIGCTGGPSQKWTLGGDGTIRNPQSGKCVDISDRNRAAGAVLWIFTCHLEWNQRWMLKSNGGEIRTPHTGQCLDFAGFNTANGTKIQTWTCAGHWNQKWVFSSDGTLRNPQSGKCVDISGLATANSTPLVLWECNGGWNQMWKMAGDGSIRNPRTNKCMDIIGPGTADGTAVTLYDCHGRWNQMWTTRSVDGRLVNPETGKCAEVSPLNVGWIMGCNNGNRLQKWMVAGDGTIRNPELGKCLDIIDGSKNDGAYVLAFECNGQWNQQWVLQGDGTIRNPETGKCVDIREANRADGALLHLWTCIEGSWNQKWRLE